MILYFRQVLESVLQCFFVRGPNEKQEGVRFFQISQRRLYYLLYQPSALGDNLTIWSPFLHSFKKGYFFPISLCKKRKYIVKWGKKQTILTNLSFYEIHQRLNIKIGFQVVKIYFLTFPSCFSTSYLQPIRSKLLKTLSVFYPTKWGK